MRIPAWLLMVVIGAWIVPAAVLAADETAEKAANGPLSWMDDITGPLQRTSKEVEKLRTELKRSSADAREGVQMRLQAENERLEGLRQNLLDVVGGAEAAEYEGQRREGLSLDKQVMELVQPLLSALREASAGPRELEQIKARLALWKERKRKADVILGRIDRYQELTDNAGLRDELKLVRRHWEGKRAEATGQIGVLESQVKEREEKRRPMIEAMSEMFGHFFRSRGLNVLGALVAGICGFLLVKRLYALMCRYSPLHRRKRATLSRRVVDIGAVLLSVLVALWAVMMVFYLRGDWLLLTVVALMLIGAAWAAKQSLPPYIEQIRMLLNLGSVREGERVMHLGLPWRVNSINFFSTLENPNLQGGELRIPIRQLMQMISREPDPKEPWFPTQVDDWVVMGDGTYGKVVVQTPEQVVVLRHGGSLKTYPSAEFLLQRPENLSVGYRVDCVFGIDYQHQKIATIEVPEVLQRSLTAALIAKFDRESIRSIQVELDSAGASSLDYRIQVDVDGSLGSRYPLLKRMVQKVCVETCNEHGWVIPFTQVTIHQASPVNRG